MLIKQLPISELKPADYNPRKGLQPGDADYEKLKRSLTEFGYVEPVIYNRTTGHVVGGHQRLKVLADLGHTDVDCVVVELDETREKALNVALNKISGDWDESKLALLIADLDAADFDAELTGFDDDEIQAMIGSSTMTRSPMTASISPPLSRPHPSSSAGTSGLSAGTGSSAGTLPTPVMSRCLWTARARTWCSPTRPTTWPSSLPMGSRSRTMR